jgi:AraC-like DNA-binding protein
MSETAFSHYFKKCTNSSFPDYTTDLRSGLAASALNYATIEEFNNQINYKNVA